MHIPLEQASEYSFNKDEEGRWFKTSPRGDYTDVSVKQLEAEGRIHKTRTGSIRIKYFIPVVSGHLIVKDLIGNVWKDIPDMMYAPSEYLGYPTQKPLALLNRIIEASSKEGDVILDPFCGCGTATVAAQSLNRKWLGIDVTWLAIDLVEKRLLSAFKERVASRYEVRGRPVDMRSAKALADMSKKEFETWALTLVGAAPREHDNGVDGIFGFVDKDKKTQTIVVQIKGGENINPIIVRDLIGTVQNEGAAIGLLITLAKPSKGMLELAVHSPTYKSDVWGREFPSMQIRTIEELLAGKAFDLPPTQSPLRNAQVVKEAAEVKRLL